MPGSLSPIRPIRAADPIRSLVGVGTEVAKRLARLEIATIGDLLLHFPRRYDDWQHPQAIGTLRRDKLAVIEAECLEPRITHSPRKRLPILTLTAKDDSGEILLIWFGQVFLARQLQAGRRWLFRGAVSYDFQRRRLVMLNPQIEREKALVPIYPETSRLTSKQLRHYLHQSRSAINDCLSIIPSSLEQSVGLMAYRQAIQEIHQPTSFDRIRASETRLAIEEVTRFILQIIRLRAEFRANQAPAIQTSNNKLQAFTASLPYILTDSQRRAAWEIIRDLERPIPMNRLLQGDVGSGKTVVAAFAAFVAAQAGYRTVWMVPTELLAQQHARTLESLFQPHQLSVSLRTGRERRRTKISTDQSPDILIGTHALLHQTASVERLGLIIIDEQHRFGVDQRAALRQLNEQALMPHFLSMTATPIPRTLALSLYGELTISRLTERPPGRQPVTTRIIPPRKRDDAYHFIHREVQAGHQVFIVCPMIEESPAGDNLFTLLERKSAIKEYERLRREIFPDLSIGLLHGKLTSSEKAVMMEKFVSGTIDILVTTAVIEVGIDIPNATVMLIESADHFGLSQLHQFRGRVGRGLSPAHCLLFIENENPKSLKRLQALERYDDGLTLAEVDLRLRGPGQLLGTNQSGLPSFRFASILDLSLIDQARQIAESIEARGQLTPEQEGLIAPSATQHLE